MNLIRWAIKASKQARKLDRPVRETVSKAIDNLALFPDCANVKALTNHEHQYRLRVGQYRVLFNYDGTIQVIEIQEVKKRDERTY